MKRVLILLLVGLNYLPCWAAPEAAKIDSKTGAAIPSSGGAPWNLPAGSLIDSVPIGATGSVTVKHANNTSTSYIPTANTDVARGTSLTTALSAHVDGDDIILSSGTFQVGSLILLNSVTLEGVHDETTIKVGNLGSISGYRSIVNVNGSIKDNTHVKNIIFDCNLAGQTSTGLSLGAVVLRGSHVSVENCTAINFGTTTASNECFVIFVGGYDATYPPVYDVKVKGCRVYQPANVVMKEGVSAIAIASGNTTNNSPGNGWIYGAEITGCSVWGFTNKSSSTATITVASPGVVTWTSHGLNNGDIVSFTTTGALPTGLATGTNYYIVNKATNTFQLSLTAGGSAINTTGSQSGTHTAATVGRPVYSHALGFAAVLDGNCHNNWVKDFIVPNGANNDATAFYHDSFSTKNIRIHDETYDNVYYGVSDNLVGPAGATDTYWTVQNCFISAVNSAIGGGTIANWIIDGNWVTSGTYSVGGIAGTNIAITNNTFDVPMYLDGAGAAQHGNYTSSGVPVGIPTPNTLAEGGTGGADAVTSRTNLGVPTGTSGHTLPFLDGANTFSAGNVFNMGAVGGTNIFRVTNGTTNSIIMDTVTGGAPKIGFLGASALIKQTGDLGTAAVNFGLMSGTPTFNTANLTNATSATLAGVLSDETGFTTGAQAVFSINPLILYPPVTMTSHIIDITKHNQTDSIATPTTNTLSGAPVAGQVFGWSETTDSTARVVTLPSGTWTSEARGGATVTTIKIPASSTYTLLADTVSTGVFKLYGEPLTINDLTTKATPVSADTVSIYDSVAGVDSKATVSSLGTAFGALQWDGGSTNLVAATGRTSLGATTVGGNIFTLTNPSAIGFVRTAADNTVSTRTPAQLLSDIGAQTAAGTTTNDNATAGNIGEYVVNSLVVGSATALTTATPKTVTSISLTAGDWDVTGIGSITGASTGTNFDVAVGTTTNSFTGTVLGDSRCETPTVSLTGADASLMIPAVRVSLASTTTVYLIVQETFTIGSPAAYGRISARRVR